MLKIAFWSLIAVLSWGVAPVLDKLGVLKVSPGLIMFIQSIVIATIIGFTFFYSSHESTLSSAWSLDWKTWACVIMAGVLGGVIGEYAYFQAISSSETGQAVALMSAYPLVTVVCSVFVLGETVSASTLLGIFLVVSGVAVLSMSGGAA